jgi:hypothetical protein
MIMGRLFGIARKIETSGALALVAMLLLCAPAFAQTVYWELEPKKDPAASIGTYTVVGGKTTPDGVNFTLKNNKIDMPLVLTLVSKVPSTQLHLAAFKDAEPFLDRDTDPQGHLVVKFRTGDDMHFRVTGPAGAEYQLSVWRGPEIILPASDPIVSMESVIGKNAAAAPSSTLATSTPTPASPKPVEQPSSGISSTVIYVLLGAILIALGGIAFLLYRGQQLNQNKGKPE